MSSSETIKNFPERLGIVAGGGALPRDLIAACRASNIDLFVIALDGQTDDETVRDVDHKRVRLGALGALIKAFKARDIQDVVMIGRLRRPSLKELKPDLKAAEFFATGGLKAIGDDGMLRAIRAFMEKEGFTIHGIQDFMPELLTPHGVIGRMKPKADHNKDIARGVAVLSALGPHDVGQAIVVQQGHVLGVEAAEGTDTLIKRCAELQRKGQGAVLVKLAKDGQDQSLDLPTIGEATIENCAQAGFSGIAVHAGHSLIQSLDSVRAQADAQKIFLIGIEPKEV